jgi:hypothetical protein
LQQFQLLVCGFLLKPSAFLDEADRYLRLTPVAWRRCALSGGTNPA